MTLDAVTRSVSATEEADDHSTKFRAWIDAKRKSHPRMPLGVSFRDLGCHGLGSSTLYQPTFLSYATALPRALLGLFYQTLGQRVEILQGLDGLLHPGEMLLVLGRPGSGCSTFLKTLAGDTRGFHVGDDCVINYQGMTDHQMRSSTMKCSRIYLAELDVHFPELTVGETLTFAAEVTSPKSTGQDASTLARTVASLFSLDGAYDTQIGDAMIRGVSGGEKRRTSLAEAFIRDAQFQFWDNSTRGLDSSTALRFVRLLRKSTDALRSTVAMSIYQASDAMYESFDKVLLLYEGRQIYFGPTSSAVEYFTGLGFVKPDRATTADFLTSLTSPAERVVQHGRDASVPTSPDEFARAWKQSERAKALLNEIEVFNAAHPLRTVSKIPIDEEMGGGSGRAQERRPSNSRSRGIPFRQQVRICTARGFLRLRNNYVPAVSAVIANSIIGIVIGTVYYRLDESTDSMQARATLLFLAVLQTALSPAFDIPLMWAQRPIVEKHARYAFYRPVAEMLASFICSLPQKALESVLVHVPIYFMSNLRRDVGAFFVYWLFMFVVLLAMSTLFRMVGSLSKRIEQTLAPNSTMVLFCVVYAGFVVPPAYMVPWLGWVRWVNPISYAYESLMINEFSDRLFPCATLVPDGPGYMSTGLQGKVCPAVGAVPGDPDVQGSAYVYLKYGYVGAHLWMNLAILLVMVLFFGTMHLLAAEYVRAHRSRGEVLLFKRGSVSVGMGGRKTKGRETTHLIGRFAQVTVNCSNRLSVQQDHDQSPSAQVKNHVRKQRLIFHWNDLGYDVKTRAGTKRILRDINGWAKPGTLTAIIGVTGAGKTSLLDVLSDRAINGTLRGAVLIGNKPRDASFNRRIGYVQQEDVHLPTATVREALEFSALLRQPAGKLSADEKVAYVDAILKILDMESYADAIIGIPGEGLNVEQRRRLTIAVEMVANPELMLFLDEPTSGLDSQTAWSICMLLRHLANNGQAILCTIHQPSAQLFQIFDRLLLLGQGGEQLYFGDIGPSGSTVINYFESNGAPECPRGSNPAEWILEITTRPTGGTSPEHTKDEATSGTSSWARVWDASPQKADVLEHLKHLRESPEKQTTAIGPSSKPGSTAPQMVPLPQQFSLVLRRNFLHYWRDPIALYSKLGLCLGISLSNSLSFINAPLDIQGLVNLIFSMFLLQMLFAMLDQQIIPRLTAERALFEGRERRNQSYSWIVFVAANIVVELLWQTVVGALVFVTWYFPTGMWRNGYAGTFAAAERGGLAFVMVWLFCLFISTLSHAVSIGIPLPETAVQMASLLYWFSLMFCGVLVFPNNLPTFWTFVHRATPFTYLMNGLLSAGLANTNVTCSTIEQLQIPLPPNITDSTMSSMACGAYLAPYVERAGGYVVNPADVAHDGVCLYCPIGSSDTFFGGIGINIESKWRNAGLLAVYVVFNIFATFVVYWLARVPKKPARISS